MFEKYRSAVLAAYNKKEAEGSLSINLTSAAPAKLKKECLWVYENQPFKKQDKIYKDFFEINNDVTDIRLTIKKFETDKFRPLCNFIKGMTNEPEDKNVELLAWLIDFEPRPYSNYKLTHIEDGEKLIEPEEFQKSPSDEVIDITTPRPPILSDIKTLWKKIGIVMFLLILFVIVGILSQSTPTKNQKINFINPTDTGNHITGANRDKSKNGNLVNVNKLQCMYWNEDHYEPIACDQIIEGVSIIALNQQKVDYLKKITNRDTIGRKDIGRTWYFKIAPDSIDLYTDSGSYPLDEKRILKPLSQYMLTKYILSKR